MTKTEYRRFLNLTPSDEELEDLWTVSYANRTVAYPGSRAHFANRALFNMGLEYGKRLGKTDRYDEGFASGLAFARQEQVPDLPQARPGFWARLMEVFK